MYELLSSLGNDLKFIFITSQARLERVSKVEDEGPIIEASKATKCERCWHYREDVGHDSAHPMICGRCTSNLFGLGESRQVA